MPQKILFRYRNPEVFWVSVVYTLIGSLLLLLRVKNGAFIFVGLFIVLVILIIRNAIKKYCETTITEEGVSIRTILLNKSRTFKVNDPKLSFNYNPPSRWQIAERKITVSYDRKALSQHDFMNERELKWFYETTLGLGFKWKNKPR